MTLVIGISGRKRAGKNLTYFLIKLALDEDETGRVVKVSMADALKEMARRFGWDGRKDERGRRLLQLLGTEVCRQCIRDDYWVTEAEKRIAAAFDGGAKIVVVPDIRFPNEAEMVKRLGGIVWRVERPSLYPIQNQDTHPSELAMDAYPQFDAKIVADDAAELLKRVHEELALMGMSP